MWECEWLAIKTNLVNKIDIEKAAKAQNINIRDALFGGRTEGFKSYHKCIGKQVINYDDVTSLYPTERFRRLRGRLQKIRHDNT